MPTMPPIHPGEILLEEFLEPLKISQYRLAKDISVPPRRINEIVHGKRAISADTALRLARYFGTTDQFWLNLQMRYNLELEKDHLGKRLEAEVRVLEREVLIEANTQEMEDLEDLLTSSQLAALAGLNHDQIVFDWLKKGHIVGWKNAMHEYVFPAGQFDKHGQPIKRLDLITQLFDDAYEMWYWLTAPNNALDGAEPLALLHKGEVARVKAAAKGYLQGDFG